MKLQHRGKKIFMTKSYYRQDNNKSPNYTKLALQSVAVHEYANSTSAHDTVLEHRFSPMRTPFTS